MSPTRIIYKNYMLLWVPAVAYLFGLKIDRMESERMSLFRDKSALYGRTLKPGEPPSWP